MVQKLSILFNYVAHHVFSSESVYLSAREMDMWGLVPQFAKIPLSIWAWVVMAHGEFIPLSIISKEQKDLETTG